ncbi:TonB-dependent receptor plug domain-containing protein [Thalassotalea fusca]
MPTFGSIGKCIVATLYLSLIANTQANNSSSDFLQLSLAELVDTKVSVASLTQEKISQTPVPISVITSRMITQSGATSLKQLLVTYVPGFTNVTDQNEINIAARGIFTSAQQKILILLNGHRLNSRSYSMAAPDHSISLDKIKQIEILRGPASALYGNVSLTATINIILKKPDEFSGIKISALTGNYGQRGISVLSGANTEYGQALVWLNSYHADGEKINLAPQDTYAKSPQAENQAILNGIRDKSPYDIGFQFTSPNVKMLFNARRAHSIEPYTAGGLSGEPYQYEQFDKIGGYGPGLGYETLHFNVAREDQFNDWQTHTALYWDKMALKSGLVIDPVAPVFGGPTWQDNNVGLLSTLRYSTADRQILFGTQLEYYKVYGAKFPIGVNSQSVNSSIDDMLPSGSESTYSLFTQINQKLSEHWHANLGFRYDYKNRRQTNNINELSPRLGVVYNKNNASVKLSYSESFVDATYWNRFSTLPSFKGATDLKPERLRSLQLSPSWTFPEWHMQLTTNIFYDQSIDVIYRNNAASNDNYSNAGKLYTWGIEQEFSFVKDDWQIRANATYRAAVQSELIATDNHYINNVPLVTANLIVDKKLSTNHALHVAVRYIGRQFSPIVIQQDGQHVEDPFPNQGVNYNAPTHYVSDAVVVNTNWQWHVTPKLSVNFQVENVFDEKYYQGGSTLHPYQQTGRWFYLRASYRF